LATNPRTPKYAEDVYLILSFIGLS
jgi:hypothetical protein